MNLGPAVFTYSRELPRARTMICLLFMLDKAMKSVFVSRNIMQKKNFGIGATYLYPMEMLSIAPISLG